jgi:hypothetical protein
VQYRAFIGEGEGEACDSPQGGEGDSIGEGEAYNSLQGENNSRDGLQKEQEEPID